MSDPKPLAKPWMATELPYLDQYRFKTFEDGDPSGGYAKYSELQKPYMYDEDIPEDYIWWEWVWPDFPPIGDFDPIDTDPCHISEDCTFARIIGTDKIECGDCYTFTQLHVYIGCEMAPWWAAFGSWELIDPPTGVDMRFSGPVMATICVADDASDGTFTIKYNGPLNCVDEMDVRVEECGCCKEFVVEGPTTINPGATWQGVVTPSCEDATCAVTSNSGCTISCEMNPNGSKVFAYPGASDCGSFKVTVSYTEGGCDSQEAYQWVRINNTGQGGSWVEETTDWCWGSTCGSLCTTCNASSPTECDFAPPASEQPPWEWDAYAYEQYKYGEGSSCSDPIDYQCNYNTDGAEACDGEPPNAPAKKAVAVACIDPGCDCLTTPPTYNCDDTPSNDYWYNCNRCEWECTC